MAEEHITRAGGAAVSCAVVEHPAAEGSALDSDGTPLARLVSEYAAPLYRYAYRLCGSAADAEDLTQQTFLIAHERLGQVREAEKAGHWLFAVLRNTFLKSRRRSGPVDLRTLAIDVDQLPAEEEEGEIDEERLGQCLAELPEEFRVVLLMFYFEDLSYKEIAAELDVPLGTVMSRLSRAKHHLRAGLAAREGAGRD